jgi:hypothetical protein
MTNLQNSSWRNVPAGRGIAGEELDMALERALTVAAGPLPIVKPIDPVQVTIGQQRALHAGKPASRAVKWREKRRERPFWDVAFASQ